MVCAVTIGLWRTSAAQPVVTVVQTAPIVLSWPTNFPSFALQTTTNLGTNVAWQNWVATPAVSGTNYVLTNGFYLGQVSYLVCPGDSGRVPASSFQTLGPQNVTYRLRTGDTVTLTDPTAILAVCPVDANTLLCEGEITNGVDY